jgi:hypothetical protein
MVYAPAAKSILHRKGSAHGIMAVRGGKSAPSRGVSHHSRPPRHSVPAPRKAPLRRAVTEVHEGRMQGLPRRNPAGTMRCVGASSGG